MTATTKFCAIISGLVAYAAMPFASDAQWYNSYKSTAQYYDRLDQALSDHPTLATPITIGQSWEGRDIRGIRVTGTGTPDVARKTVVIHGLIHAREWIAGMTTMYAADRMLDDYATDPRVQNVLDNTEFVILPVINPDGYEYSRTTNRDWRKNRRNNGDGSFGVDLNRNFGYQWGPGFGGSSGNKSSDLYRGPSAFSEPETEALRGLFLDDQDIVSHIDFHSYGQIIAGPWGYTLDNPPLVDMLDRQAGIMAASIEAVSGERYLWGDETNVLGLANGITNDWAYGDQGVFSYTVELRPDGGIPGFELPASQITPTAEENFPSILDLAEFTIQLSAGDFNFDDVWDCADVDALVQVIQTGSNRAEFDMNGDGAMSPLDLTEWLAQAGARRLASGHAIIPGDANLDGAVDGEDFVIWNQNHFTETPSFCSGDFDADGAIDGNDFLIWNSHRFTSVLIPAVPEPTSWLACMASFAWILRRRFDHPTS